MSDTDIKKAIVLIGGGGHASVICDILRRQKREICAIISPDEISARSIFRGMDVLRTDDEILKFEPDNISLINCIGSLPGTSIKKKVNEKYLAWGFVFETLVSDLSYVSAFATLLSGVQVFTGAIIQPGVRIGNHTVINSGAIVEHDTVIGDYSFIAPGAVICGQCKIEENVFIGANATIVQNIHLRSGTIVTAGALVTKDTLQGQKVSAQRSVIK